MENQFITLLAENGPGYQLVTLNVRHVVSFEDIDARTTRINLINGKSLVANHALAELTMLVSHESHIAPTALTLFNREKAKLVYGTELFPTGKPKTDESQ